MSRLVIVSNRVPQLGGDLLEQNRASPVGGLVSALHPALKDRGGIWFGWSGKIGRRQQQNTPKTYPSGNIVFITVDLTETEVDGYYTGFSNRTLWPLFHSLPSRVSLKGDEYAAYKRVNSRLAKMLNQYLKPDDIVWIHDYHLIPLGAYLRDLGWKGSVGFFMHTPFPPIDIFSILPWARELLENFLSYDLVGFQIDRYRRNFMDSLLAEIGGKAREGIFTHGNNKLRVGVYPIGIEPESFQKWASSPKALKHARNMKNFVRNRRLILGVDRLDYTKGIVERLRAFEKLLDRFPSWQRKVSLIQISAPSRTRIPEYISQKRLVDQVVGEINGRFADASWTPVSYFYRSYGQEELAGFYRAADVCLVSPLRDGMNLVAKEFIASQGDDAGVLVLSRFSGAADDLKEALIINPYDIDGTARRLREALEMPFAERKDRWNSLMERVARNSAGAWRDRFLHDLMQKRQPETGELLAEEESLGQPSLFSKPIVPEESDRLDAESFGR